MSLDNGRISTILISILAAFAAAIIADPSILGTLGVPIQYTTVAVLVISIIYNALYPRNPSETLNEA